MQMVCWVRVQGMYVHGVLGEGAGSVCTRCAG